jgi:putative copper export protein
MEVILKFIHVVGLSVWLGSMVTWAVFAPKLNKYDPTKNTTGVLRISFSKISWSSYVVSLLSGITLYFLNESTTANWYIEVAVLGLAGIVIAFHSFATNISVALRGVFNGVMLLLALIAVYLTTIYI